MEVPVVSLFPRYLSVNRLARLHDTLSVSSRRFEKEAVRFLQTKDPRWPYWIYNVGRMRLGGYYEEIERRAGNNTERFVALLRKGLAEDVLLCLSWDVREVLEACVQPLPSWFANRVAAGRVPQVEDEPDEVKAFFLPHSQTSGMPTMTREAAIEQIIAAGKVPATRDYTNDQFVTEVRELCGVGVKEPGFDRRTLRPFYDRQKRPENFSPS
jgi:hypothetical protein